MIKNIAFITTIALLMVACETSLEVTETKVEAESELISSELSLPIMDINTLFSKLISNGFFIDANGQAHTFVDGAAVCHEDYPDAEFIPLELNSSAPEGLYLMSNGSLLSYEAGVISTNVRLIGDCTKEQVFFLHPRCEYLQICYFIIEDCYDSNGVLISSDTVERKCGPCEKLNLEFNFGFFEDEFGNSYLNPICR